MVRLGRGVGGEETELCAYGIISLVDAKMTFTPGRLELRNSVLGSGELPPVLDAAAKQALTFTLDPGELPFTVTPTAVTVDSGVLSVKGTASDVVLGGQ